MKSALIAITLAAFVAPPVAKAHADSFSFKHITMQDGLSSNKVYSTYRDSRGFIWFSTAYGLNRFDGYTIKVFPRVSGDSTTIGGDVVSQVWDIADERLLINANHTYSIFDKRTETFRPAGTIFKQAGANPMTAELFVDEKQNIWIADGCSFTIFSTTDERVKQKALQGGSTQKITAVCESGGHVLAAHKDATVSVFTQEADGDWRLEETIGNPGADNDNYHGIFADSRGNIWLTPSNSYGLWFRSATTKAWTKCDDKTASPLRMPNFVIRKVVEDQDGRIWVASDHGGINVIDLQNGKTTEIRSRKNSARSLPSNSISDLYADSQGCVWVGDVSMGVSVFGEPIYKFGIDNLEADAADPDFVAQVNCISEDQDGDTWYGTNDYGLLRISAKTGAKRVFKSSDDKNSLSSNIVVSLCPDGGHGIWIGTFLGGLCHFDGQRFTRFKGDKTSAPAAGADNVWSVAQSQDGSLWVGSLGQGLAMRDSKTSQWKQWGQEDGLPSDYVTKVTPMNGNMVAVGTSEGICIVDPGSANAVTQVKDSAISQNTGIVDMHYDSRGLLWACTNTGIHVIDGRTLKYVRRIDHEGGLPTDGTLGVTEDRRRIMWVTTTRGITSVEVLKDDRNGLTNFKIYNYNDQDGTLVGSINERAITCTAAGEIIVGRANGVNRFHPEDIRYNVERPVVSFISLSTFGKEAPISQEEGGGFHLAQALTYSDAIELPYDVNMFTISFSTLSNILPDKVTYTYKLDGFNDNWIRTSDNHATYTNLSPGDYRLTVRAANCDGLESEDAATLQITIAPPWWRTPLAYAAYLLTLAGIIFLSIKWIRDRDKAKFRLRQIMDEVERQHQVDDMKLRFFTNVSHELRTPLSLIVSPIENILDTIPKTDPNHSQMELIYRNSQKLLRMVNQLLDFRKTDMGGMTLNLSEGDLISFVKQHSDAYIALDKKNIKFTFTSNCDKAYMKFDKDKIGKVVTNLLSNAFKFTPAGGLVTVAVDLSDARDRAFITVADSGVGIPDAHKQHIFERFYQVPQKDASIAGSGIGLNLVKDFVSMHNGTISVTDNAGGGTVFKIELPVIATDEGKAGGQEDIATAEVDEESPRDGDRHENSRKSLVIVDDNADFLTLLRDTLRQDYSILEAHNGQEAWNLIVSKLPDLIITDVMMPIMDGNELCKKVKNDVRTSHIQLIMLTAKTAEEHNIEGLANGADDYLTKPFNPKILRLKVQKIVDQAASRRQTFKRQIEPEPSQITITTLDEQLIKKAIAYVETNIASPTLSVEDLSKNLGMSRVHLYKKLTTITGRSPIEFIRVLRLKRAAQMLKDPSQNVADVAYAVGFNNPKYFTKYFKEEFGVLPSKFHQQAEKDAASGSPTINEKQQ